jgi:hypothetical protein
MRGVSIDETDARGMKNARAMDVDVKNFDCNHPAVLAEWETPIDTACIYGLAVVKVSLRLVPDQHIPQSP